jgi:8-oxo-dGTP pyrophosphatase MutT (NUDIX family)/transcriptional regulator with XRE-family HTH domain
VFPSEVFREQLRTVRRYKGWTQQRLADELDTVGVKLDATAITRLERGTRGVTLDDVIAIAAVLGVSPLHLFVPLGNGDSTLDIAPGLTAGTADVRAWIRGQVPLRDGDDDSLFYTQAPDRDWDVIALAAGSRFKSREDFEATRAKWERAMLRRLAAESAGSATEVLSVVKREAEGRVAADRQPVVAAIVTSELGVLVGRRNDGESPWTFIAGEQDAVKDENPVDTAVREVKEETGLRVTAGEVIGERVHPTTGRTMIYIAAAPIRGTDIFVGDEDELAEVRWVGLAEAVELLPGMFEPVREYLERELGGTA